MVRCFILKVPKLGDQWRATHLYSLKKAVRLPGYFQFFDSMENKMRKMI